MKKTTAFILALAAAALLAVSPPAEAQAFAKALTSITTSTNSAFIPTGGSQNTEIYAVSTAGSTSSLPIQACVTNAAASCYTVATISNVAAAGAKLAGPSAPYLYIPATVSAGTVTVYYATNNFPRLATWNDVKVPVAAGGGSMILTNLTASGAVQGATLIGTGLANTGVIYSSSNTLAQTAGFTFDGTTLLVPQLTDTGLAATYVPFAGTGGLLSGYSGLTYVGAGAAGILTAPHLKDNSLTATRVTVAGASDFVDYAGFTYTTGTGTLAVPTSVVTTTLVGAHQDGIAAKATDGAIASAPGTIVITKGSALGTSTLATPTTTTHDGYRLTIVAGTAFAHVITVATGKLNGAAVTTITFTSAAIGDSISLVAYQGIWLMIAKTGTITLS